MTPKQRLLSLATFTAALLAACSALRTAPTPLTATATLPVQFRDYNRDGTLSDHAIGTAYVFDNDIEIVIRSGVFPFSPDPRFRLIALSAALANGDTAGPWHMARQSSKVFVSSMHVKGDTLQDSLTFWIRGTRCVDLARHWLLLTEHASMFIRERQAWAEALRPIHGDLAIFKQASIAVRPLHERCN